MDDEETRYFMKEPTIELDIDKKMNATLSVSGFNVICRSKPSMNPSVSG